MTFNTYVKKSYRVDMTASNLMQKKLCGERNFFYENCC